MAEKMEHTTHEFKRDTDLTVEQALKRLAEISSLFLEDRGLNIAARQHPVHGPIIKALHREAVLIALDNIEPGIEPSEESLKASAEIPVIMSKLHMQTAEFVRDIVVELGSVLATIPPHILMQLDDAPLPEEAKALVEQVEAMDDSVTAGAFKVHPDLAALMAVATACAGGQENFMKIQMGITAQMKGKIPEDSHPASKVVSIMVSTILNSISLRAFRPQFVAVDQRLIIELMDMSKSLAGFGFAGQWDRNAEQLAKKYFTSSVNHMTSNLPSDEGSIAHKILGDIPVLDEAEYEQRAGFMAVGGEGADLEPAHQIKVQGSGNSTMFSGNKTVN